MTVLISILPPVFTKLDHFSFKNINLCTEVPWFQLLPHSTNYSKQKWTTNLERSTAGWEVERVRRREVSNARKPLTATLSNITLPTNTAWGDLLLLITIVVVFNALVPSFNKKQELFMGFETVQMRIIWILFLTNHEQLNKLDTRKFKLMYVSLQCDFKREKLMKTLRHAKAHAVVQNAS